MELATDFFDVIGMTAVLGSAAIVFATIVRWIAGKYQNRVMLGLQMLVFFALAYFFTDSILAWLNVGQLTAEADRVIATLLWLSVAFLVNSALKVVVWDGMLAERGVSTVPRLLTDFVSVFIYLVAIMIIMHFVYGEPITAIAATSGAAAFVIGYSAQTTLGELFAGISLNLSRSFKKGDNIQIGDVIGRVDDVNWRSVSIYDYTSDATVIYPNSAVAGAEFVNISRPARRVRGEITVTAEFTSPPDLVVRAIKGMLQDSKYILRDPPANVFVKDTNEMGIEYGVLYFFAKFEDRFVAKDEATQAIWSAFKKYDIQPGTSHREFGPGSRFDEGGWPERHREKESLGDVVLALARCELFRDLPRSDLEDLAGTAKRYEVTPPEVLFRHGARGGSLFVIAEGKIGIVLPHEGYADFTAVELGPGDTFGIPSLLTGAPRMASAQGVEFSIAYELAPDTMLPILERTPELRQKMIAANTEIAADNERRRKAHVVDMEHKEQLRKKQEIMSGLSGRIGDFFSAGGIATLFGKSGAASHEAVMEVAMAATALVAIADGVVEDEERAQVIATFDELDLLRHVDTSKGLAQFEDFANAVKEDWDQGIEDALAVICTLASDKASSELVLGICIAVSAADGEVEEPEEEMIALIRDALELNEGDEDGYEDDDEGDDVSGDVVELDEEETDVPYLNLSDLTMPPPDSGPTLNVNPDPDPEPDPEPSKPRRFQGPF